MQNLKIYIIAGEASGDVLGAKLMEALRHISSDYIDFHGIGGDRMIGHGLCSLFPMSDIAIMGFTEIVPHIPRVLDRINKTVEDIIKIRPDVLVTIDAPGFCTRVAEKVKNRGIKLVHYVAPTVWAYKPGRAKKFAKIFDHILLLLPFEAPYFEEVGLAYTYVGHPIIEDEKHQKNSEKFREKNKIKATEKILCVMPGSRVSEIDRHMPVLCDTISDIVSEDVAVRPVIVTVPFLRRNILSYKHKLPLNTVIIDSPIEKYDVFKSANAAIVKSGTGALEVSLYGVPLAVIYKVSMLSYFLIRSMIKVKFVNLLNLIMDKEIIPEFIQYKCRPKLLAKSMLELLNNAEIASKQKQDAHIALTRLGLGAAEMPSIKAAKIVLAIAEGVRAGKKPYQ